MTDQPEQHFQRRELLTLGLCDPSSGDPGREIIAMSSMSNYQRVYTGYMFLVRKRMATPDSLVFPFG